MNAFSKKWIYIGLFVFSLMAISGGWVYTATPPAGKDKEELSAFTATGALSVGQFIYDLAPARAYSRISRDILTQMEENHYRKLALDDEFSERVFDQYLSNLDASRSRFTAEDIAGFEKYRHALDDAILAGDMDPAFTMFNRYRQRHAERLVFIIGLVGRGVDKVPLNVEEELEIDRKNAAWLADAAKLDALWRKRLKNEILSLKLADKPMSEIGDLLDRRYRGRLHRLGQMDKEDAFLTFTNAWTEVHDPHARYFSPQMVENFNIHMSLSLEGIGALLQAEDEFTKVLRLIPAGPAEKAGELKPGDRIVGVGQDKDGEIVDVVGWRLEDVVNLIRGPKQTVVRLEIIPADAADESARKILGITRNTVKLEEQAARKEVKTLDLDGKSFKVGVVEAPSFYIDFDAMREGDPEYKSTTRDVRRLLGELVKEGVEGVVIDLRNNGGGALQEASDLTGLFIRVGPTVQVRGVHGNFDRMEDKDKEIAYDGPLVVLVNRLSASASEIFAGAIQDYGRGVVVGGQTFGKGTVQSLRRLDQGQLKYTVAKFYRISGEGTQYRGVLPDVDYPAIYDAEEIGESALPNALPWDRIESSDYRKRMDVTPAVIDQLTSLHQKRIRTSPDFVHLIETLDFQKELDEKTRISLSEATRKKERDASRKRGLAMENKRRSAKGLALLESLDDEDEEDESEKGDEKDDDDDEPDPVLEESCHVLIDLARITQKGK